MGGVDEGYMWRATFLENREKEQGGREKKRDDNDRANVPASMHAALGAQHPTPTQEACLCYS